MTEPGPIRRDPKYRPNHHRSITISGVIDNILVSRLLPEIVKLQAISRDTITVYIDSPGGDTECARLILEALRAGDQDRGVPCRLITVALGEASSAASDILTSGDYTLAYAYSRILCHGTRIRPLSSFTKDQAATYARLMTGQDEGFALTLARNCIDRFMFTASRIVKKFQSSHIALKVNASEAPTATLLAGMISHTLMEQHPFDENLLGALRSAANKADETRHFAQRHGLIDHALKAGPAEDIRNKVRSEILKNAADSSVGELTSFAELETNYLVLCDLFESHHSDMVSSLNKRWDSDLQELNLGGHSILFWLLFVFFCRQLQTGDFPMTATEAYWLGLIDEVIGIDLPSPRVLVENAPDIPTSVEEGFQEGFQGARKP